MFLTTLCALPVLAQVLELPLPSTPETWVATGRSGTPTARTVRVSQAVAPQPQGTTYCFTTLAADAPWFSRRINPSAVVATRVRMSGMFRGVAAEGRTDLALGNVQVEQWFG